MSAVAAATCSTSRRAWLTTRPASPNSKNRSRFGRKWRQPGKPRQRLVCRFELERKNSLCSHGFTSRVIVENQSRANLIMDLRPREAFSCLPDKGGARLSFLSSIPCHGMALEISNRVDIPARMFPVPVIFSR